jgi:hypothetical protein
VIENGAAAGGDLGETKVENPGGAAFADEDIGRLDGPVEDAWRMSGIESVGDFDGKG